MATSSDVAMDSTQSKILNNLANELHVIFQSFHLTLKNKPPTESPLRLDPEECLECSTRYRSVLRNCVVSLREAFQTSGNEALRILYRKYDEVELMWGLCEIFFLRAASLSAQGGYVVEDLVHLVNDHAQDLGEQLDLMLLGQLNENESWILVYRLLMRQRFDEARNVLFIKAQLSSSTGNEKQAGHFVAIDDLISSFPSRTTSSVVDYERQFAAIQGESLRLARSLPESSPFHTIALLLSGDERTLESLIEETSSWLEVLVARLGLTNPLAKIFDLDYDIKWALGAYKRVQESETEGPLTQTFLTICGQELNFLKLAGKVFDDWTLHAHVTDLLYFTGWIGENKNADTLREEYILKYVEKCLETSPSLWQLSAAYLNTCGSKGVDRLGAMVLKQSIRSEKDALKILHFCSRHDLTAQYKEICCTLGKRDVARGRLVPALIHYLKAKEIPRVTDIANSMLLTYSSSGNFSHCAALEGLGAALSLCDRLLFLVRYMQFHRLVREGQLLDAAALIMESISAHLAPKWFHFHMLLDVAPLLEHKSLVFTASQTETLMVVLSDVLLSHRSVEYGGPGKGRAHVEGRLQPVRLALVRNLARGYLVPSP